MKVFLCLQCSACANNLCKSNLAKYSEWNNFLPVLQVFEEHRQKIMMNLLSRVHLMISFGMLSFFFDIFLTFVSF